MYLPDERIKSFQELWKKHFGKEITKEDATEKSVQLIRTIRLLYKPITENELKNLEKRKVELKNL